MYMLSNILFFVEESKPNILEGKKIINNFLDHSDKITQKFEKEIHDLKVLSKNIYLMIGDSKNVLDQNKKIIRNFENSQILVMDI